MKPTQRTLAMATVLMLGAASLAYAGAEISLVGDPDKPLHDPGEAITVSIYATMTEAPINPYVALRGMQLDYSATDPRIGLPMMMDFVNTSGVYAEFEHLPVPASVWPLTMLPIHIFGIVLELDTPVLFGTVEITAPDEMGAAATLDVANADEPNTNFGGAFTFGFGVTPDDPITVWRFNTGELTGGTLDITTVPEPATIGLFLVAVVALRRGRMVGSL